MADPGEQGEGKGSVGERRERGKVPPPRNGRPGSVTAWTFKAKAKAIKMCLEAS